MLNYKDVIKKHHTEVVDEMPIDNPIGQFKMSILRKNITRNDIVLDAGAGNGVITKKVKEMSKKVYAVDFTPKMVEQLKLLVGIEVRADDITNMMYPSEFVDVVYSYCTLYYIQELEKAISEFNRILKKNGKAVLEFENKLSPLKFWIDQQYKLPQKRIYPWQIKKLLKDFEIKKVHYYRLFPSFMGSLSQSLFFGKIPFLKYFCLSIIVEVKKNG